MDAVTYPHETVATTLNAQFVPFRLKLWDHPDLARKFQVAWTPTFLFVDGSGVPHYQYVGYLPPEDFLAVLGIGPAWKAYHDEAYDEAGRLFGAVCSQFPKTLFAPEARFFEGASAYRRARDVRSLFETWQKLLSEYPESDWARKVRVSMSR